MGGIEPGTYTALVSCGSDELGDDASPALLFKPQTITVTADDPGASDDLVVGPGPRQVTLAGSSCTAGSVDVELASITQDDLDQTLNDDVGSDDGADGKLAVLVDDKPTPVGEIVAKLDQKAMDPSPANSDGFDGGYLDTTVDTKADGSWTLTVTVPDDAVAEAGDATCGDPLADGFVYATQTVMLPAPPTTTSTPVTAVSAPAVAVIRDAAPASPRTGSPRYTG